jgi:hypothetical protein
MLQDQAALSMECYNDRYIPERSLNSSPNKQTELPQIQSKSVNKMPATAQLHPTQNFAFPEEYADAKKNNTSI